VTVDVVGDAPRRRHPAQRGSVCDPWDNALQESAIGSIKGDLVLSAHVRSARPGPAPDLDYIENFYNRIRAHSSLGTLSPDEYEHHYHQQAAAGEAA
jgi:transposase InsO family protein